MPEYIEREAFYRFLTEQKDKETGAYSKGRNAGLDVARSALHNKEITPAADVEPVKPGRWLQPKPGECFCSECQTNGSPQWKRCPVCEAKMDGGDNDA